GTAHGPAGRASQGAMHGTTGAGGHSGTGTSPQELPAPAVWWAEATGHDRHGPGQRAGVTDRRRTHHRPGCHRAEEGPGTAQTPAAAARQGHAADAPWSEPGAPLCRYRGGYGARQTG